MPDLVVVAIGGNALSIDGTTCLDDQVRRLDEALLLVVHLMQAGNRVLVTHGNGPQVGSILLRSEAARGVTYNLPLDYCVAQSQGEIGYSIAQRLESLLAVRGIGGNAAVILTRTLVAADDPAMATPTKAIGPVLSQLEAAHLESEGVHVSNEPVRGRRRMVPSPQPHAVLELESIRALLVAGATVVAAGGGGIPVYRNESGELSGVEAVVDKDLTGALLAAELGATEMYNLTAVDTVCLWYGQDREQRLSHLTKDEAVKYLAEGHFAPGSMRPKIEGAVRFLQSGGRRVVITSPQLAVQALAGSAGTTIE